MRFRVGPHVYAVRIEVGPIVIHGKERMGACDESRRRLCISSKCPPRLRMAVLWHELAHAWLFHVGEPRSVEGLCDLTSTIILAAMRDFIANGGEEALLRLEPGESPLPGAARMNLTRERYCGECRGSVGGASVVCEVADAPGLLNLALYCEHCSHVQHWQETATNSGLPSGTIVGDARYVRGAEATAFLREHPKASGLVMA